MTIKSWVNDVSIGTVSRNADGSEYTVSWIPIGKDEKRVVEVSFDKFPITYLATLEAAGIAPPACDMINRT